MNGVFRVFLIAFGFGFFGGSPPQPELDHKLEFRMQCSVGPELRDLVNAYPSWSSELSNMVLQKSGAVTLRLLEASEGASADCKNNRVNVELDNARKIR